MLDPPDSDTRTDAVAALAEAERVDRSVRARSGWYRSYLIAFGVGTMVTTATVGFVRGPFGGLLFALLWGAFITSISVWASRQPVARRGLSRRNRAVIATWAAAYLGVIVAGEALFPSSPGWWLTGAVIVSLPCFVAARHEAGR